MEDGGGFVSSLLCDVLTFLGHRGFFLFSLVYVLDTPEGSFGLAVPDLVHIDPAFAQGVTKVVEIL